MENDSKNAINTGVIIEKLSRIEKDIVEINKKLEQHYVSAEEFKPVKALVYGMVALILTAFIVAMITLVIR